MLYTSKLLDVQDDTFKIKSDILKTFSKDISNFTYRKMGSKIIFTLQIKGEVEERAAKTAHIAGEIERIINGYGPELCCNVTRDDGSGTIEVGIF